VRQAHTAGLTDEDMRAMLAGYGLEVSELDAMRHWSRGPEHAERARGEEAEFFAIADSIGGRSVNAVVLGDRVESLERVAEAYAGLCDRASEHGLLVHLEFLPWTAIPDLATAWEVVRVADRPNGGLLLDSWHWYRGRPDPDLLRTIPGDRIMGVQIDDAPAQAEADFVEETVHRRLLPGQGDFALVSFVRLLDEVGADVPIGVEVFSDALAELPPVEVAQRAADATRAVLAQARASAP
jgi:sugar phosphate isomerase/epimerase